MPELAVKKSLGIALVAALFSGGLASAQGQGDWAAIAYGIGKGNKVTGQPSRGGRGDRARRPILCRGRRFGPGRNRSDGQMYGGV